jgi:hypothetical protein
MNNTELLGMKKKKMKGRKKEEEKVNGTESIDRLQLHGYICRRA